MDITLTTPALLFPAVSLILLAYTNRFLALAALTRTLYDRWNDTHDPKIPPQIENLRYRVRLIRQMQTLGVGRSCSVWWRCSASLKTGSVWGLGFSGPALSP